MPINPSLKINHQRHIIQPFVGCPPENNNINFYRVFCCLCYIKIKRHTELKISNLWRRSKWAKRRILLVEPFYPV